MRHLNTEDVFKTARLLKYSGLKDTLFEKFEEAKSFGTLDVNDPRVKAFGLDVFFVIIDSLAENKVEGQFYELMAGICEKTVEDIKTQSFNDTWEDLKRIATENDLKTFFAFVSKSTH